MSIIFVFVFLFFVWRRSPVRVVIVIARNPPMKFGSSHVDTSLPICGSQPYFAKSFMFGCIFSCINPAIDIRSADSVIVFIISIFCFFVVVISIVAK